MRFFQPWFLGFILLGFLVQSHLAAQDISKKEALDHYKKFGGFSRSNGSGVFSLNLQSPKITENELAMLTAIPELRYLFLQYSGVTDSGLVHVAKLKNVERLYLDSTKISDDGLKRLKDLKTLKRLSLFRTGVTDKGLQCLTGMAKLEWLNLSKTKVTDDGIKNLRKLPALKTLWVSNTEISDKGLETIGQMKQLEWVSIGGTKITGDGLTYLENLKSLNNLSLLKLKIKKGLPDLSGLKLKTLYLNETDIDDDDLKLIAESFGDLEYLFLEKTEVTDAGLMHLKSMKKLKMLSLNYVPKATESQLNELRAALPNCRVVRERY